MKPLLIAAVLLAGCAGHLAQSDSLRDSVGKLQDSVHVLIEQSSAQDEAIKEETQMIVELCVAAPHACVRTMEKHRPALDAALERVAKGGKS